MDNLETKVPSNRSNTLFAVLPFVLLSAAWALNGISRHYAYTRALAMHGHDVDMADTFQREGYASRLFLPFMATVIVLDILGLAALIYAAGKGLAAGCLGVTIAIAYGLTFLWHGLGLLGTLFFRI